MRFSALNQSAFKKIHCRGDKNNAKCAQMSDTLPGLTGAEVCSGKHIACRLRLTSVADLICNPHKKKICRVNKTSWTLNFGVAASRRTQVCFLSCCQAVSSAVLVVARQPHMTLAVAAVQLGFSTDREALSDTTIASTCHNADALAEGTGGMPLPCL